MRFEGGRAPPIPVWYPRGDSVSGVGFDFVVFILPKPPGRLKYSVGVVALFPMCSSSFGKDGKDLSSDSIGEATVLETVGVLDG